MNEYSYYNGVYTPYNAACIPLSDRSVFFSDAVYDVIIGLNYTPYQLDRHLERLFSNAQRIGLSDLPSIEAITEIVYSLLSIAQAKECFMLYIQLSANSARRSHERKETEINTLVTVTECKAPDAPKGVKAISLPDVRHRLCSVKTTNLLPAVLSVEEANRRGADIAIFHKNGVVTECSYANLSILKGGVLITHPLDFEILPGITQNNLIDAALTFGVSHVSREFTLDELHSADAVLITSTTKFINLCTEIDGEALNVTAYESVKELSEEMIRRFYDEIGIFPTP